MDQAKVISLDHELALERQICGGKAANLAKIFQAGVQVPFALILTVQAYNEFKMTQRISETVKSEIMNHLLMNQWLNVPLAVRSSGISEDSDLYAHAGQWMTLLNVVGETGILKAVVQC